MLCGATGELRLSPWSGADQRAACQSLLATLEPAALSIPQSVLASLPPRPAGYGRTRKLFPRYTGLMFDAISPAVVASDHTISEILQPDRAARLVEQHALDPALPGLEDVITGLLEASAAKAGDSQGRDTEGRAEGGDRSTDGPAWWSSHASGQSSRDGLSGARRHRIDERSKVAVSGSGPVGPALASDRLLALDIQRFLDRPGEVYGLQSAPGAPPGAPIGMPAMDFLGRLGSGGWDLSRPGRPGRPAVRAASCSDWAGSIPRPIALTTDGSTVYQMGGPYHECYLPPSPESSYPERALGHA